MKLTIECLCKVPYEVEFEPVDGKVPGPVYCPNCDADATDYANWLIEQETARTAAVQSPPVAPLPSEVTIAVEEPVADENPPVPHAAISLKPSGDSHAAETEGEPEETGPADIPRSCYQHPDEPVEMFCFVCKRPICIKCMKKTGFVCSSYCRQQADRLGLEIPLYEGQQAVVAKRKRVHGKLIGIAVTLMILGLAGLWVWFAFVGSKPSVTFSLKFAQMQGAEYCKFIAPNRVLWMGPNQLALYDVAAKKQLWSTDLTPYQLPAPSPFEFATTEDEAQAQPNEQVPSDASSREKLAAMTMRRAWAAMGSVYGHGLQVQATGQDIWLSCPTGLVRFDQQTGKEKSRIPIEGTVLEVTAGDASILVSSMTQPASRTFTSVDLPTGKVQTEQVSVPLPEALSMTKMPESPEDTPVDEAEYMLEKFRSDLIAANPNVVQMEVKLVKANILAYQAMKPPDKPAITTETKVTDTIQVAEEIFNEWARERTGGVRKEDESQYDVTLRRFLSDGSQQWTGEVVGRPTLFPLKTVDVLVAGKVIHVFDKANKKLWTGNLSYPVSAAFASRYGSSKNAPGVERDDMLYFFDQGVLTAFGLRTGSVRWRLPSVGISKIQFEPEGMLYVTTTSASPEAIQYSQQVSISKKVVPIIMKVDPASGKKLWAIENLGDNCYPSGKFLYVTTSQVSWVDVVGSVSKADGGDMPVHFRIYRINPSNGKIVWEHYQPRSPAAMDFQGNKILLLYPGELQVLKFLSL